MSKDCHCTTVLPVVRTVCTIEHASKRKTELTRSAGLRKLHDSKSDPGNRTVSV